MKSAPYGGLGEGNGVVTGIMKRRWLPRTVSRLPGHSKATTTETGADPVSSRWFVSSTAKIRVRARCVKSDWTRKLLGHAQPTFNSSSMSAP
jgi:hypothetical protein